VEADVCEELVELRDGPVAQAIKQRGHRVVGAGVSVGWTKGGEAAAFEQAWSTTTTTTITITSTHDQLDESFQLWDIRGVQAAVQEEAERQVLDHAELHPGLLAGEVALRACRTLTAAGEGRHRAAGRFRVLSDQPELRGGQLAEVDVPTEPRTQPFRAGRGAL